MQGFGIHIGLAYAPLSSSCDSEGSQFSADVSDTRKQLWSNSDTEYSKHRKWSRSLPFISSLLPHQGRPMTKGRCWQGNAGPEGRPQGAILSERARLSCPDIEVQNCEDVCVRSKGHFGAPRVVLGAGRQLDNQTV